LRELPHLVEMQDTYGKDGLVILSVNLDDPKDAELRPKVVDVLAREKASFSAVAPATKEDIEPIVDNWKVSSIPLNVIYGRDGKVAKRIEGADIDELKRIVREQLEKK
jgi:hypothetical protein